MSASNPAARQYPVGREDFFWSQVSVSGDGCWEWIGTGRGAHRDGEYGQCGYLGEQMGAHKAAYMFAVGPIPEGLFVLHACDNRWCVRPAHLFLGTAGDNYRDAIAKNRHPAGERHGCARITRGDADAIRSSGERSVVLAERFGVGRWQIWRIRTGKSWRS